ncbi:MAG: sulfite exporter TauE/SafE family protein [Phycisphaerae bacterium]
MLHETGSATLSLLLATAAFVGFFHTITGPDHYVPFIAMARVGGWSVSKTILVTTLCGIGHVASSVLLGALGIAFGWAVSGLTRFEGLRGELAGWLLIGFGFAYTVWGVRRAIRGARHSHWHAHGDGTVHDHPHDHEDEHAHVHAPDAAAPSMTPWILFTIFVFGPCEPLIPILMYPAATVDAASVVLVALVFGLCTIGTMLGIVLAAYYGSMRLRVGPLERASHALAGLAVLACGAAIKFGL